VETQESPVPGTTTSVNTINPTVQTSGAYSGGANSTAKRPFNGKLGLRDAIERGLEYNLGAMSLNAAVRQAQGQSRVARSTYLPNINGTASETAEQVDLQAEGLRFSGTINGFAIPTVVGPFQYFDIRARLTENLIDLVAWNNGRAANANLRSSQFDAQNARDLVVLAVGGAYLQVIAAKARVESVRAQAETAEALYQQALQKRDAGLVAKVDSDRSEVESLTQQQRLVSLQNDLAKQKINLARMTGLPATDQYEVSDDVPFAAAQAVNLDDALAEAGRSRTDLKAAEAQVQAAERARAAAGAERLPSLAVNGDYGLIGVTPEESHGTFSATATLRIPIWQGGKAGGDIEEADAALQQRRAELDDLRNQVEGDVRQAYLDLQAAASQVEVAQRNLQVVQEALDLTRQRFDAGVTDNVEVIQAQESAESAQLDYINSVFAHNLAKLSLARAMGRPAETWMDFLKVP
jgi:outer membrane protein TolC